MATLTPKVTLFQLTNAAAQMFQGGGGNAGLYDLVVHMHASNARGVSEVMTIWYGTNAAGDEIFNGSLTASGSNGCTWDWYGKLYVPVGTYLYGLGPATAASIDVVICSFRGVVE